MHKPKFAKSNPPPDTAKAGLLAAREIAMAAQNDDTGATKLLLVVVPLLSVPT